MLYKAVVMLVGLFCILPAVASAEPSRAAGNFASPLVKEDFDLTAYRVWVDGGESSPDDPGNPSRAIATRSSEQAWDGVRFGNSKNPGERHLRYGFTHPILIGTVVARSNCKLSYLKATATYPGDMHDESQWEPAQRITPQGEISTTQSPLQEFACWLFPSGTSTRAIRFTHEAQSMDKTFYGAIAGACVISPRMVNIAPQSKITASSREEVAGKLINGIDDSWQTWDNSPLDAKGQPQPIPGQPWFVLYWPEPITLSGLLIQQLLAEELAVDLYTGPADRHPRQATERDWKLVKAFDHLKIEYPLQLSSHFLDLEQPITARAIRIRLIAPLNTAEGKVHPHKTGSSMDGRRYSASEVLLFSTLGQKPLESALFKAPQQISQDGPVAINLDLPEAGMVTLVIEDPQSNRVRNLISETPLPAGASTVYWDAMDDLGRDVQAASHGLYIVPGKFVSPGEYRVRGLFHKPISLKYEFNVYSYGTPPWETQDTSGGWLTNHTPPSAVTFVPGDKTPNSEPMVYIGSHISEGGAGLAWVNLEGKKLGGRGWVGGNWTGAQHLCRDAGPAADANVYLYVGSVFEQELRLTGLGKVGTNGSKDIAILKWNFPTKESMALNGIAVRDGLLVASLPKLNQLMFIDAKAAKLIGTAAVTDPRGMTFDAAGNLLVLSGKQLVSYPVNGLSPIDPSRGKVLVGDHLEDPQQITLDANGQLYISDAGNSHQVKVFTKEGRFTQAIGNPGAPSAGLYDSRHMNHPTGMTIDAKNQLWVTESDAQPKRVSVWSLDGKLLQAMYGPPEYGGGGRIDPKDKTRYYYHGMEFRLDWERGTSRLFAVICRLPAEGSAEQFAGGPPEYPHYVNGRRYWSNSFNSSPTNGSPFTTIWIDREGHAVPVAALGRANDWKRLREADCLSLWPKDVNLKGDLWKNLCACLWLDRNGDGLVQPDEVVIWKVASLGSILVQDDLTYVISRLDGKALCLKPQGFTAAGVPQYDMATARVLVEKVQHPVSSGGDQVLFDDAGHVIATQGIEPLHSHSVSGALNGQPMWSYPNLWPGLHPSHEAPVPDRHGEIIGVTRLLGNTINPTGSAVGPIFAANANMGNMYLFTMDGLFVSTLFHDVRQAPVWTMPLAQRGMDVTGVSLHDENFWPTITQTSDGKVYITTNMAITRVDGLETLRPLALASVQVTEKDLDAARTLNMERELQRQKNDGSGILNVFMPSQPMKVDGDLADWSKATWVSIDKRGTAANFNSNSRPYTADAAVAVVGDNFYAAWRTNEPNLLQNAGGVTNAPFKTGGALDVMIGTDPAAKSNRQKPVAGDLRLLVTRVNKQIVALVYRAVVTEEHGQPVSFASPGRSVQFDLVQDVSSQVQLAHKEGNYEISIPLAALGLKVQPGLVIKGDIGLLRGNGFQTLQRVYWNNKATAIVSDVPSEAELLPALWGMWQFGAR